MTIEFSLKQENKNKNKNRRPKKQKFNTTHWCRTFILQLSSLVSFHL